jgi:hypothetical protein
MTTITANGIISKPTTHSVDEVVAKIKTYCRPRESLCSRWSITAAKPKKLA